MLVMMRKFTIFYGKSVTELKKETIIARGAADDFLNSVYYVN